jgi:hypothetical protein
MRTARNVTTGLEDGTEDGVVLETMDMDMVDMVTDPTSQDMVLDPIFQRELDIFGRNTNEYCEHHKTTYTFTMYFYNSYNPWHSYYIRVSCKFN